MRRLRAALVVLVVLGLLAYTQSEKILAAAGHYLVLSETPRKVDVVFVLAGDFQGRRVMKACQLIAEGYASKAWVSGPDGVYGLKEADLAVSFATQRGCPADRLEPFYSKANSTRDEALLFAAKARQSGFKTYLLVTSDFHTRRAARLFRREAPDLEGVIVAASDANFDPDNWWRSRPSQKTFAFEWIKTVTEWVGL